MQMVKRMAKNNKWVLLRGDVVVGTFSSRQKAISHLRSMLKQTLNDLEGQEKQSTEYDYSIEFPTIKLYGVEVRPAYLGL